MEIDLELYKPIKIDDAFHCQPSPGFEWWYFDAAFDNGYSLVTSWHIAGKAAEPEPEVPEPGRIAFAIYDPEGKRMDTAVGFPVNAVSALRETCDVKMGDNHLHGEIPKYEIHFRSGDLGGDLVYENLTQGFRYPPDGVKYLTQEPPMYMGWAVAQPRAKVTGKLILAGKEIPVNGVGYHDHNWGPVPMIEFYGYWYWGRLFLPNHTFLYSTGESSKSTGSQRLCSLIAFKGEKLFECLYVSNDLYEEASDIEVDELTGAEYPRKLVIKIDSSRIKGQVTHRIKKLIESHAGPPQATKKTQYCRFLSDCHVELDMESEKIEVDTEVIHELMIP